MAIEGIVSAGESDAQGIWDYYQGNCEEVSLAESAPTYPQAQFNVRQDLSARIKQNLKDNYAYSLVDDVVRVKTLSAAKRTEKSNYWKSRRLERITLGTFTGIGGVAAVFNGVAVSNPLAWVVMGVGAIGLSIFGFWKASQAHDQVTKWNRNLPEIVAHKRQIAFDQGLIYIMKNDKSSNTERSYASLLSVNEMQGLYHDFFKEFSNSLCDTLEGRDKVSQVKVAARYSPLSAYVMDYGKLFPHQKEAIAFYTNEHLKFLHVFNSIESRRCEMQRSAHESAYAQIRDIEREKEQALTFVYASYSLYAEKARQDYAEALKAPKGEGITQEEHAERTEKEYQNSLSQARHLRDIGIRMIGHPFNIRIEEVERLRDDYLREIRFDFDAKLLPFFNHVARLHQDAYLTFIGQGPQIYPDLQDPDNLFQPPIFNQPKVPSAPPSYEEVFGNIYREEDVDPKVYEDFMGAYRQQPSAPPAG